MLQRLKLLKELYLVEQKCSFTELNPDSYENAIDDIQEIVSFYYAIRDFIAGVESNQLRIDFRRGRRDDNYYLEATEVKEALEIIQEIVLDWESVSKHYETLMKEIGFKGVEEEEREEDEEEIDDQREVAVSQIKDYLENLAPYLISSESVNELLAEASTSFKVGRNLLKRLEYFRDQYMLEEGNHFFDPMMCEYSSEEYYNENRDWDIEDISIFCRIIMDYTLKNLNKHLKIRDKYLLIELDRGEAIDYFYLDNSDIVDSLSIMCDIAKDWLQISERYEALIKKTNFDREKWAGDWEWDDFSEAAKESMKEITWYLGSFAPYAKSLHDSIASIAESKHYG